MELSNEQVNLLENFVTAKRDGTEDEADYAEWQMLKAMIHPSFYYKALEFSNTNRPIVEFPSFIRR